MDPGAVRGQIRQACIMVSRNYIHSDLLCEGSKKARDLLSLLPARPGDVVLHIPQKEKPIRLNLDQRSLQPP